MKKEYTGITDEVVTKTVEIILNMLETNDYIVGSKIDDFLWFPQIDVDWNEFLLENLIIQSKQVNIVYLIGVRSNIQMQSMSRINIKRIPLTPCS